MNRCLNKTSHISCLCSFRPSVGAKAASAFELKPSYTPTRPRIVKGMLWEGALWLRGLQAAAWEQNVGALPRWNNINVSLWHDLRSEAVLALEARQLRGNFCPLAQHVTHRLFKKKKLRPDLKTICFSITRAFTSLPSTSFSKIPH